MNTTIEIVDRKTVSINFDSTIGNETVLLEGDVYDGDIKLYKTDILSNPSLSRCNFSEIEDAISYHNSLPCDRSITIIYDDEYYKE